MKQKFVTGKNISQIAREEGRHWDTVSRTVKERDVEEYVRGLRERFYAALEEVVGGGAAIEYAKTGKDGGWLAYEMLQDGGVIPPRTLKQRIAIAEPSSPPQIEDAAVKRNRGGTGRRGSSPAKVLRTPDFPSWTKWTRPRVHFHVPAARGSVGYSHPLAILHPRAPHCVPRVSQVTGIGI